MSESTDTPDKKDEKALELKQEEPIVTQHTAQIGGKTIAYTATAGRQPQLDDKGEVEANLFYTAYTKDGDHDPSERPIMFSFNGGPGSPSVWLHLGALGPKRVKLTEEGFLPQPPFQLVDNDKSWLEFTDIVLIDPIGTGFSQPKNEEVGKKAWGLEGDVASIAEFIRLYLARNGRFSSPLYLAGESYGTTRAAGLSSYLVERGITFNGIVLVSSILNFQTARFTKANDLPYRLFLPTYTAGAHYHGKLGGGLQSRSLQDALEEARGFVAEDYMLALDKGDTLTGDARLAIRDRVSELTGLSTEYVENRDLRIHIYGYCKELLRKERRTVGRMDARFQGIDANHAGHDFEHDPSISHIMPPYVQSFNQYVRAELNYETDLEYKVFKGIGPWDWGSAGNGHPDTSESLRLALSKSPNTKVHICSGYYDLATPFHATEWTVAHLGLDTSLRDNVSTSEYEAGHMMYLDEGSLAHMAESVGGFVESTRK